MKKTLLLTVMLALGAAPQVATAASATAPVCMTQGDTEDMATQEEYNNLMSAISSAKTKIDNAYAEIKKSYPWSDELSTLTETKEMLDDIEAQAMEKYIANELTSEYVTSYLMTVQYYSDQTDEAVNRAEAEYEALKKHYTDASDAIANAYLGVPKNVEAHYSDAIDNLDDENDAYSEQTETITTMAEYNRLIVIFDSIATTAKDYAAASVSAGALVDSINIILPKCKAQIENVQKDFPSYDVSQANEAVNYWNGIVTTLTSAPAEGKSPCTSKEVADYTTNFGYFKDEVSNLYNTAQQEEFMAQFSTKYTATYSHIMDVESTLDAECPDVKDQYFTQLDDLAAELSQMYMTIYSGTLTKEQFDSLMTRVDTISAEADSILVEAKKAQATGISGVTVDNTSSAEAEAYTIGGVRVDAKTAKGIVIIGRKKVVKK